MSVLVELVVLSKSLEIYGFSRRVSNAVAMCVHTYVCTNAVVCREGHHHRQTAIASCETSH